MKVAVVDDNPIYCECLRTIFDSDGFEVIGEAYDGAGAVRMVREQRPEVVVMDINMPLMGGLEAAGIISADSPETAVILTSAEDDEEYRRKALEVGALAFIPKGTLSAQRLETLLGGVVDGR